MTGVLHSSRRGLTFLEMVFASALLALVAAGAFSTIGFVGNMHKREQQTLGAAELASSIIIQYLDDKNGLPSQIAPVDYGPWQYRYTIREDRVGFRPARSGDGTGPARTLSIERIKQVTVKVWLTEEREGGESTPDVMPSFELTRVLDPLALRNPDSFKNMMESDQLKRQFGDEVTGGVGGLAPPPGSSSGNRRTPPKAPANDSKSGGEGK
ncbi:MAG: hypothetical protein KGS45_08490 [Planctomycetes bacterium]|nr:hypothetical protein [Planctomycetota bacterium]